MTANSPLLDFELPLQGKRVLVTGHTGFTGGWLVSWLKLLIEPVELDFEG